MLHPERRSDDNAKIAAHADQIATGRNMDLVRMLCGVTTSKQAASIMAMLHCQLHTSLRCVVAQGRAWTPSLPVFSAWSMAS